MPRIAQPVADKKKEPKTSVANDESKRWRGGRGSAERMEERMDAAYSYILEGGTRRQITAKIQARFNVSKRTADDDYSRAMGTLRTEQVNTKEDLLNQVQALRLVAVAKALKRGQLSSAIAGLDSLARSMGEGLDPLVAQAPPQLNISVELPLENKKPAIEPAEIVEIDPAAD